MLPPPGEGACLAPAIDHASQAAEAVQVGQREVGPRALRQHQAVAPPILRQQADAGRDRPAGRPGVEPPAVEPHLAGLPRRGAEDDARDLAAARAHQAREPQDLAAADAEGHVADPASGRQSPDLQPGLAERSRQARRELRAQAAADHGLDKGVPIEGREGLARRKPRAPAPPPASGAKRRPREELPRGAVAARGRRATVDALHQFAVAKHGNPVGHRLDLLQPVADVDRGGAASREFAHLAQQRPRLPRRQRRGRLVQDQQPGLERQRLRDLDGLARAERQIRATGVRIDVDLQQAKQTPGLPLFPAPADDAPPGPAGAEEEVLAHAELRHQAEFLVDDRDSSLAGIRRRRVLGGLASELDPAAVRPLRARDDPDQRALAGAVLADQAQHLAGAHRQADGAKRLHARVALADPMEFEQRDRRPPHGA